MIFVAKGDMIQLKNIIFLLLLIVCTQFALTQTSIDSSAVIYGWQLEDNYITPEKAEIDTNLVNFQLHNPVYRKYNSLTTLGSNGSAYLANSFFQRSNQDDLLFLNSYKDYLHTYENTLYINSRKPFTHLQYITSWPKSDREEVFKAFHSQNINSKWNIGFDIAFIADKAQYKYIDVQQRRFSIFSSYNSDNYTLHASFNLNRNAYGENGGVVDTSYYGDWDFTKNISTSFTGGDGTGSSPYEAYVTNRLRYIDGMVSQSFKILTIGNKNDSTENSIAQPIISHVLKIRRAAKIYENSAAINNQYYDNIYSNISETYDSAAEYRIANKLQLDFKTKLRKKVIAGVYGSINHEYLKYTHYSLLDTSLVDSSLYGVMPNGQIPRANYRYTSIPGNGVVNYDTIYDINSVENMSNIFVTAGLYGKFWTHFESRFNATLYIQGYKAGQTKLDGIINTNVEILKRPYQLLIAGSLENIKPSYQLNNYYSNHYMWSNDFDFINKVHLSSKLVAPSNGFEIEGHYALLNNFIYLTDSMPNVYNKPISVSALTVQKEFIVWKFHSFNKLTYQVSENRSIIEIPSLLFFNSTYIDHTWLFKLTDGRLRTMMGVDIYYNTAFNGYNYIPALSLFAQPSNSGTTGSVGNHPYVDVWLNIRLKRTRFFFKYEHVNQSKDNQEHFYAVNYPSKLRTLTFGLSWTFYD